MAQMFEQVHGVFEKAASRFVVVGAIGFAVDSAVLTLLVNLTDLGVYLPRLISFPTALSVTWYLNRIWTFPGAAGQRRVSQYMRYTVVQTLGALLNLGVYSAAIAIGPSWYSVYVVVPLVIGSCTALVFNFAGSKYWVFGRRTSPTGGPT